MSSEFSQFSDAELEAMLEGKAPPPGTASSGEGTDGEYVSVPWDHIFREPGYNTRPENHPSFSTKSIEELANGIAFLGLLENLVVCAHSDKKNAYTLRAGERRWRAIGLLIADGRWPKTRPVMCKVVSDGAFEHIAENVGHEQVPPWNIGKRYVELLEKGHTQSEIAKAIGKSQPHVSMCVRLARGLAPKVIDVLNRLGSSTPNIHKLILITTYEDPNTLQGDEERQMKALQTMILRPTRRNDGRAEKRRPEFDTIMTRIQAVTRIKGPYAPILQAVTRYLLGVDTRLEVPALDFGHTRVPKASKGFSPKLKARGSAALPKVLKKKKKRR